MTMASPVRHAKVLQGLKGSGAQNVGVEMPKPEGTAFGLGAGKQGSRGKGVGFPHGSLLGLRASCQRPDQPSPMNQSNGGSGNPVLRLCDDVLNRQPAKSSLSDNSLPLHRNAEAQKPS